MKIKYIQKIIDKVRCKHKRHHYINELGYKILSFEKIKDEIDTIILGSSHAQLGYRAKSNEFNLGLSFQDLYYSYHLYNKYSSSKIKNIILFYSVFSPGNQTIKTKFADTTSIYKIVCGIDYQDRNEVKIKKLKKQELKFFIQYKSFRRKFSFDSNYRGNEISYKTCFKPPLPSERAEKHYKNNRRGNCQTNYVVKINELAQNNDANLLVVIPPATKGYKSSLPSSKELFRDLFDIATKNSINILNTYDTEDFEDTDFEDWDHLNIIGANKLTEIINAELYNIKK